MKQTSDNFDGSSSIKPIFTARVPGLMMTKGQKHSLKERLQNSILTL